MNKRQEFETDLKKKLQFLNWQIKDKRQEKKPDQYQLGYLCGQKHLVLKLLEIIKNGGLN